MSTTTPSPDYSRVAISGFLGFPHQASPRPIEIDGDIVLLSGANGAGKSSLLEALALTETGQNYRPPAHWIHRGEHASDTFNIRVGDQTLTGQKNGSIEEFPAWWQPEEVDRKRHLRPVYFHPHYLDKLFEVDPSDAGTSFVDLIAPTPQAVVNLNKALSATLPAVDAQISRLEQQGGFISEAEQKDQRRQLIHAFKDSIKRWKELHPTSGEWLGEPTEYRLVIKNGNPSDSWPGQLNNFAAQSLSKLGDLARDLSVSKTSQPAEALRTLAEAARLAPSRVEVPAAPNPNTQDNSAPLPPDLVSQLLALTADQWSQLKRSRADAKAEDFTADFSEKQLAEQLDAVRRLRNELGRGEAGFPDWIASLQQRSETWRKTLNQERLPAPVPPLPNELRGWLDQAVQLAAHWSKCEPYWAEWAAQLDDTEKRLSFEREQLQTRRAAHRHLVGLAKQLDSTFSRRPQAREAFARAETPDAFLAALPPTPPADAQPEQPDQPTNPRNPAEAFATACQSWADFEQRVQEDTERRQSPDQADLLKRIADLRELRAAIDSESRPDSKSRLGRLQQEALDAALPPLQDFLNKTAIQFRIFENIRPIRLERFSATKKDSRLRLKVGQPPRDIGQTSSGQRSQLGLLTFLALHYGLRDTYRSQILCLDEVTSSFDLGQIPRLALLLRQIAYAPPGSAFKRRVFIASHNEEFSQRLAELLTPPAGSTLRVLRFKGYDSASGPEIKSSRIQPALPFNPGSLTSYFRYRYGPQNP